MSFGDAIMSYYTWVYAKSFAFAAIILIAAGVLIAKGCDFAVSRVHSERKEFEREAIANGVGGLRGNGDFAWVDIAEETRLEYKRGFEDGRKSVFSEMRESGNLEPVPRIPAE